MDPLIPLVFWIVYTTRGLVCSKTMTWDNAMSSRCVAVLGGDAHARGFQAPFVGCFSSTPPGNVFRRGWRPKHEEIPSIKTSEPPFV
jgi:hypothetical protein